MEQAWVAQEAVSSAAAPGSLLALDSSLHLEEEVRKGRHLRLELEAAVANSDSPLLLAKMAPSHSQILRKRTLEDLNLQMEAISKSRPLLLLEALAAASVKSTRAVSLRRASR